MPAVQSQQLVDAILDAVAQSGENGLLVSSIRTHPRKFVVSGGVEPLRLWVYAWTLTPGGRPQLKNEYRIQMTSVSSPLGLNPDGPTVLMGYEPNLNMFAGFDVELHTTFTSGSPSVQVNIESIRKALQNGLAFGRKENREITLAIRPDHFMTYVRNAQSLHNKARQTSTLTLLEKACSLSPVAEEEVLSLGIERQRLVQTISRVSRSANFRQQVLNAYGNRCAITRMQLRLVEAAHILPVPAPGSVDHVRNGIALSPTYHRAFDSGLIYIGLDYEVRINPAKETQLKKLNLTAGLPDFRRVLGKVHLPPDKGQWPDPTFIKRANKYRDIHCR
ncbi:MAG: HNH endonuclease [Sedimentisphaerales bacterium]|nr:HNH endonuclease [Sedimentisphaerales bacterium]